MFSPLHLETWPIANISNSFFALLIVIIIGFTQGFVGLDNADNRVDDTWFIMESMVRAILGSPEFDGFDKFAREYHGFLSACPQTDTDVRPQRRLESFSIIYSPLS